VSDILKLIRLYIVCLALFPGPLQKEKWKGPDHTCSVSCVKVIAKELSCSVGGGYVESRCQGATEPSCRAAALSSSYSRSCIKELVICNNCDPLRENPAHPAQTDFLLEVIVVTKRKNVNITADPWTTRH